MIDVINQAFKKSSINSNRIFNYCINLVSSSIKELENSWYQKEIIKDNLKKLIQSLFSLLNNQIIFIEQISKYDIYSKDQHKKNYLLVQQIITINKTLINKNIQKIISLKCGKENDNQNNLSTSQEINKNITLDLKNRTTYPLNLSINNKNYDEVINSDNTVIYRNNLITNDNSHHKIFLNQITQKNKVPIDLKKKFHNSNSCKELNLQINNSNNSGLENESLFSTINNNSQRSLFSMSPRNSSLPNNLFYKEKKNDFILMDDNPVRKVKNIIINAKISNSFFNEIPSSPKNRKKNENYCENIKSNDLKKLINNSIKVNKTIFKNRIEISDWDKYKNKQNSIIKVNYKKERECGEILQDGMRKMGKILKSSSYKRKNGLMKNKSDIKCKDKYK